jgi:hypothetical protein
MSIFYDPLFPLGQWCSVSAIVVQKIYPGIHTSDMQRGDELKRLSDSRELYSTLYFVPNVSEGDGTNLRHLSVS